MKVFIITTEHKGLIEGDPIVLLDEEVANTELDELWASIGYKYDNLHGGYYHEENGCSSESATYFQLHKSEVKGHKLHCNKCGKPVSTEVPNSTVVRAVLECPECVEKENEKPDDLWKEDPDYPRDHWHTEVANDDTILGYWDWVNNRKEQDEEERK